ncbi:HD-GYP domain-containing protein [Clostridium estertheticum]|uniref:HD-GYP domain-containing protein n=1 Tax=Clostridium estertheticum TaxID=238834 RepID=UPI001C0B358D|nr:HD domain-containing phosphohydrolase [Clostridium estertheticum]MBU3173351.1 HD domain-containing protein [Clostridium estertheticum]
MEIINLEDLKHGNRVANYSIDLATKLNLSDYNISSIYLSGLFHDIGKSQLNQNILNKPGILTESEKAHINKHPFYSYREVLKMGYPKNIALDILYHHENWNGTGYPKGLKNLEIPLGARILKIMDVFDALTVERPYRKKLNINEALSIMDKEILTYDPTLYLLFTRYIAEKHKTSIIRSNFPNLSRILDNKYLYLRNEF